MNACTSKYIRSRTEPRLRVFLKDAASCVGEHKVANSTKVNCKKCFGVDLMIIVVTGCVRSIKGCVLTGMLFTFLFFYSIILSRYLLVNEFCYASTTATRNKTQADSIINSITAQVMLE